MPKEAETIKRVLVTGASGFIGTNLVKRLVEDGYEVTTLGRTGTVPRALRELPVSHISCDVTNVEQLDQSFMDAKFDCLFHLAGLVSYQAKDVQRQFAVNVIGTRNVMNAALKHNIKRVVYTSSIAAMGLPKEGTVGTEEIVYNLGGRGLNYCDSKSTAELEVLDAWKRGLPVLILSPGITLGEGDTHSHHKAIVNAMAGKSLIFVPPGGVTFSDINDVVDAHIKAMTKGRTGERYSIVSDNLSFADAARKYSKVFKTNPRIIVVPGFVLMGLSAVAEWREKYFKKPPILSKQQAWLSQHKIFFSSAKAEEELDFKPTSFETTIERTAGFYIGEAKST